MTKAEEDLDDFNHRMRNDIVCIQSCMKEIEHFLNDMRMAITKYQRMAAENPDGSPNRRP